MSIKMIDIDDSIWLNFKKKCFNSDITMKEKLTELIKQYLEVDKNG